MDIGYIKASDGTGEVPRLTVTATRAIGATTLTTGSVTNLSAKFIGTSGQFNSSTKTLVAGTLTVFFGSVSGGVITIDSFAPGYSDIGNAIGDVVIIKPTTAWADMIAEVLGTSFNNDGTLKDTILASVVADALGTGKTATDLRVKPRSYQIDSTATLSPDITTYSTYRVTALAANMTIAAPAGTPNPNDVILILVKDNGTSRTLTWDAAFTNISGLATPTATVAGKWHTVGAVYDSSSSKWQIVSVTVGA